MIVRWGLDELGALLAELGLTRPLLVTSTRFAQLELPVAARFTGVQRHVPVETVSQAVAAARAADGLVGLGGGSAIDTAKAVSAALELPLVAVPTTYAGAEWTPYYGLRDEERRLKTGGSGARTVGIVYEPRLALELPVDETVGSAMNALAHCAEALYAGESADAVAGAKLIGLHLPAVVADGGDLGTRTGLLEGAMHAGRALAERGLYLAHAIAQALGGLYGLPHGAMNAICLAPVLRFNEPVVPDALTRLGEALGTVDPAGRVDELARLGGFERLREFGVPEAELPLVAEAAARRPGSVANPRSASPAEILELLRRIW
jgi:maleylacetate reductase